MSIRGFIKLLIGVVLVGSAALLLAWKVPDWLYPDLQPAELMGLNPAERAKAAADRASLRATTRTTVVQAFGALAVLWGGVQAWMSWRGDQDHKQRLYLVGQFNEALGLLPNPGRDIRSAGILALGQLADLSPEHRPAVAKILTAFVRERAPSDGPGAEPSPEHRPAVAKVLAASAPERAPSDGPGGGHGALHVLRELRVEAVDVQTALDVLGSREEAWIRGDSLRLRHVDLRRANLADKHFVGVAFSGSLLMRAWARDLDARNASFRDADLRGAVLRGADLRSSVLRGADLRGVEFDDRTLFAGAFYDSRTQWNQDLREAVESVGIELRSHEHTPERPTVERRSMRTRAD